MSLPTFPEVSEEITIDDSISKILTSIAMEEAGLSHIINAEGEKLQYVFGASPTINELLEINESVKDTLGAVSVNQMFLYGKMSAALNAYMKSKTDGGGGKKSGENETPPIINGKPAVVTGRTLSADKTGDIAEWVEIARNGGYSLILRKKYINTYPNSDVHDNPFFQYTEFGPDDDYKNSYARKKINLWFSGDAEGDADNLDKAAPLRGYTVKNTSINEPGTGAADEAGVNNGFSSPINERDSSGADVAFALSYGEAANFVSKSYGWGGGDYRGSGSTAAANFEKLQIPDDNVNYNKIWLRSPGGVSDTASALYYDGKAFRTFIDGTNNEYCLVQPALWVDSKIFN